MTMAAPPGAATFAYDVDFLIFCTDQVVCIEKIVTFIAKFVQKNDNESAKPHKFWWS